MPLKYLLMTNYEHSDQRPRAVFFDISHSSQVAPECRPETQEPLGEVPEPPRISPLYRHMENTLCRAHGLASHRVPGKGARGPVHKLPQGHRPST